MLVRLILCLAVCLATMPAAVSFAEEPIPVELRGLGVEEHLGQRIDSNLTFKDEAGQTVPLSKYFDGKTPVILSLIYYQCPSLCNLILNAQVDALKKMDWSIGEQFRMVSVSIDPKETPAIASAKKEAYLEEYGRKGSENGWHFLTGTKENIDALASQVGFKFKWVEETKQFAHGSAFFILTGDGKISRYMYGLTYEPKVLRLGLLEAGEGKIGSFMDRLILFCYHYDSSQKKYVVLANRIMTFGTMSTLIILGTYIGLLWRRERTTILTKRGN